tara:strand:- start:730 stop:1011 length:282 start_codon:yes stop_codon:yes gene_type:complete
MATIRQLLGRRIYQSSLIHIDGWSILHFVGFFLLGVYFPNRWGLVIAGMIAFEVFENIFSGKIRFFKETTKDTVTDILLNIVGYSLGQNFMGF